MNVLRQKILWIAVMVFLAGCSTAPAMDPYSLQQQGEQLLHVSKVLQTATAQYYVQQLLDREATKAVQSAQTTATAQMYDLQARATQTAVTIDQTRAVGEITRQANEIMLAATRSQGTLSASQTVAAATPTAEAILLAAQVDRERATVARYTRWVWAMVGIMAVVVLIAVAAWAVTVVMGAYRKLRSQLDPDKLLALDAPSGGYTVINPQRMIPGVVTVGGRRQLPRVVAPALADADRQERHNAREQSIRVITALSHSGAHRELMEQAVKIAAPGAPQSAGLLPANGAPLAALAGWRAGSGTLPLGIDASGLVLAAVEEHPHFLYAGTTGSGKTYSGLRPLIAAALADGFQAVIFDRRGVDFQPFIGHPNARLVDLAGHPEHVVEHMRALYGVLLERLKILVDHRVATWGRLPMQAGGPRILAVLDEYSNLADALGASEREDLWRWTRMVANEGRKTGIHLAIGVQDPTHRSIDLRIRRAMTKIAFRVQDAAASRVILDTEGAEALPPRQFLSNNLGRPLVHGVGFYNQDADLEAWLAEHPSRDLPPASWLDASDLADTQELRIAPATVDDMTSRQIHEMHDRGMPATEIAETIFGYKGGAGYHKVKATLGIRS